MKTALGLLCLIAAAAWQFDWIIDAWSHSPLDRNGPYFFSFAVISGIVGGVLTRHLSTQPDLTGLWVLFPATAAMVLCCTLDLRLGYYLSWLTAVMAFTWTRWGWPAALWIMPLLGIIALGLPVTGYLLKLSSIDIPGLNLLSGFGIKCSLLTVLAGTFFYTSILNSKSRPVWLTPSQLFFASATFLTLGFLVAQTEAKKFHRAFLPFPPDSLQTSNWAGNMLPLSNSEEDGFEGTQLNKYQFSNRSGETLTLSVLSAGNYPRSLHPPEYCLLGSGWKIKERLIANLRAGDTPIRVSSLVFQRDHLRLYGVYWLSSPDRSTSSHAAFRRSGKALKNEQWHLFFLTTPTGSESGLSHSRIENFLSDLTSSEGLFSSHASR